MILLTGGAGQLGTALRGLLPEAVAPPRNELDIADLEGLRAWLRSRRPSAIINAAAYTAVDAAEDDEAAAFLVNAAAVRVMAEYGAEARIPLVTFSTDYVFDGSAVVPYLESSPTSPINAYGRSKEAGERAALEANPDALVIRTSWVMSATHKNFLTVILDRADAGEVRVVGDQRGCPTVASDLAAATLRAIQAGVTGLLHVTNSGETTWYEVARLACQVAGLDPSRVHPITTEEYPTPATRPCYSVLGSERRAALGIELPPWQDAVERMVSSLRS